METTLQHTKNQYRQLRPYLTHLSGGVNPTALSGSNCYVLGAGQKRTLIDTAEWPEERSSFIQALRKFMEGSKVEIDKIFITNAQTEHYGGIHSVLQLLSEYQKEIP